MSRSARLRQLRYDYGLMTATEKRLRARLIRALPELELPEIVHIRRVYAGHWQRSEGSWSWFLIYPKDHQFAGHEICGSQWPASEVIKAEKLSHSHAHGDLSISVEK